MSKTSLRLLIWFSVDNSESIESPGLAQPLHICDAIQILILHLEPCALLLFTSKNLSTILILSSQSSRFIFHDALVTFVRVHTSQFVWKNV